MKELIYNIECCDACPHNFWDTAVAGYLCHKLVTASENPVWSSKLTRYKIRSQCPLPDKKAPPSPFADIDHA